MSCGQRVGAMSDMMPPVRTRLPQGWLKIKNDTVPGVYTYRVLKPILLDFMTYLTNSSGGSMNKSTTTLTVDPGNYLRLVVSPDSPPWDTKLFVQPTPSGRDDGFLSVSPSEAVYTYLSAGLIAQLP